MEDSDEILQTHASFCSMMQKDACDKVFIRQYFVSNSQSAAIFIAHL
jgi:hypothetical protein